MAVAVNLAATGTRFVTICLVGIGEFEDSEFASVSFSLTMRCRDPGPMLLERAKKHFRFQLLVPKTLFMHSLPISAAMGVFQPCKAVAEEPFTVYTNCECRHLLGFRQVQRDLLR